MTAAGKRVRHIMPLGPRVLVRVLHEEDVAESGLYLPAGAKERMQEALYGEVVEVARAEAKDPEDEGLGVNVSGVPHGAHVVFAKSAGIKVPWDEDLRILETKEVLATVEEISEDQIL
jgi:co-chaperonin GroES (HSP10)